MAKSGRLAKQFYSMAADAGATAWLLLQCLQLKKQFHL